VSTLTTKTTSVLTGAVVFGRQDLAEIPAQMQTPGTINRFIAPAVAIPLSR
jgi:hypothetical protein